MKEIPQVIASILSKDTSLVASTTAKYMTQDYYFQHPVFNLSSKRNASRFYLAWSRFNQILEDVKVDEIMTNNDCTRYFQNFYG